MLKWRGISESENFKLLNSPVKSRGERYIAALSFRNIHFRRVHKFLFVSLRKIRSRDPV